MKPATRLKQTLAALDGRDYRHYQALLGSYDFDRFRLIVQQVPKDPFAPPHAGVYRVQTYRDDARVIGLENDTALRRTAFADFLARRLMDACRRIAKGRRGTGRSGLITIEPPGQAILARNSVVVSDAAVEVRCFIGLPAHGRRIDASAAQVMLLEELPAIVDETLSREKTDSQTLIRHLDAATDAEALRALLEPLGLVAFVADGASLPRESGPCDRPQLAAPLVPFRAPPSLSITVDLPHAGRITGLGIPTGVTLITGGGFHGKSTLLRALELGIYNHIPGDGRERCVSHHQTVKVRAYAGRAVVNTDIGMFIDRLPFGTDTRAFSTENASGSTSQAAAIVEAIEAGARVLLMDEDTCATNFMVRDNKMQQLVCRDDEPITAFIDRVRQLYRERGISTVLVLGGVGDYFDVADHVIQMVNYQPVDVTLRAHQIAAACPVRRKSEGRVMPLHPRPRIPLADSIDPVNAFGKRSIRAQDPQRLIFGRQVIDLADLEQLTETAQTHAIGLAIEYGKQYMDRHTPLRVVAERVVADMAEKGLDGISDRICGHLAGFRALELAFALNRLRGIQMIQEGCGS